MPEDRLANVLKWCVLGQELVHVRCRRVRNWLEDQESHFDDFTGAALLQWELGYAAGCA